MIESWQDQIVGNVIRMLQDMEPADRAASVARIVDAMKPAEDIPSDLVLIHGSFHDPEMKARVSAIRRDFTRGGKVVEDEQQQAQHPHTKRDVEMNPRPGRRIRMGRPLREDTL